ncbi:STAS domain-containing protein [Stakelama sp. CBK3Z-3]|uniref:STAS domain-containing protein n=1 Tax=Stakelama flava TaxID=2860338 RepID=A0ABS6XIU7_9SPHN|nr:STAS domain-containing protein [Stakelama flava]MBW4330115.1 STAS domain-containing protein [Stakelama flava]
MMNPASIYLVEGILLVSIRQDVTDTDIIDLQDVLAGRIAETGAAGVVIDISELEIVDTFVGRVLAQVTGIARLLDAETFVVGMRPAVAMTLVELGMYLPENRTALTLTHALEIMKRARPGDPDGRA